MKTTSYIFVVCAALSCVTDDLAPPVKGSANTTTMCPITQKLCLGRCVDIVDPLFGCSATSCDPCVPGPYVEGVSCTTMGQCKVAACTAGREDCNADMKDGCEQNITTSNACGSCYTKCSAVLPFCTFHADTKTATCSASCEAGLLECPGMVCANPNTDVLNCGACDASCVAPTNGANACVQGRCTPTCEPGLMLSGDQCVAGKSQLPLGADCKVAAQCASNICYKNKCMPCVKLGANCTQNPNCCDASTVCSTTCQRLLMTTGAIPGAVSGP
jgi:hypothetical protein